jgi:CheY-like chemotaxis protein
MKYNYSSKSLPLYADIGMMDQILLNLAVNARDAMPNGGSLTITTSEIVFDKSSLPISIHAQVGKFALLTVSDTGCGIAPENINRIFEPFFTTKEVGKGTGLGLATVFGIVQQHQGWIEVSSELGKGTTFQIYLPILVKNDKKIPITDYTTEEKGNETVLIVEDEPALRILVGMYLSDLGYKVIEANNGVMALDLWKQNKNEIRLVVTDLVMPGNMSGIELAKRLQEENPKLKIIYTSGYSLEFISNNTELRKEDLFLVKPYNPLKLAEAIRLCLDS